MAYSEHNEPPETGKKFSIEFVLPVEVTTDVKWCNGRPPATCGRQASWQVLCEGRHDGYCCHHHLGVRLDQWSRLGVELDPSRFQIVSLGQRIG